MDVPYSQQFSPTQTPLKKLLPILRKHAGNREQLKSAIASAFFDTTQSSKKLAGNTLIALGSYGFIDSKSSLTDQGKSFITFQGREQDAHEFLAKHILRNLNGWQIVESLREMQTGEYRITLDSLAQELSHRGLKVSKNSSDLSNIRQWLEQAGVLRKWNVIEDQYYKLFSVTERTIGSLKELDGSKVAFLRALVALNVTDWIVYTDVIKHAELLYPGQVAYEWKLLDKQIIQPLKAAGFIEVQIRPKSTRIARGGKAARVKPAEKFFREVSDPILQSLFKQVAFKDLRRMRSISLSDLVQTLRKSRNGTERGEALEMIAIQFCLLLDLQFMGIRETDESITAGGEVDGMMHAARLVYSRWQIQCKASDMISYETIAKEVGVAEVTLANVILIVSTGRMTKSAEQYRDRITMKSSLNIIVIDGQSLDHIIKDRTAIREILNTQAVHAMAIKPMPLALIPPKVNDKGQ